MRALTLLGFRPSIRYPSNAEMLVINALFYKASKRFDSTMYKSGARRTKKDNLISSEDEMGRHNFPNYNYAMHQLHWMLGIRRHCRCHFYWPLLKTAKVLVSLQRMWERLMHYLGWICAPLEVILEPNYSFDDLALAGALQEQTDEFQLPEGLPLNPALTSLAQQ